MEKKDIEHLSALARLSLTSDEEARFRDDFEQILGYVVQVQDVLSDGHIAPSVREHRNIFREDTTPHQGGIYTDDLMKAAPHTKNGALEVKKILKND